LCRLWRDVEKYCRAGHATDNAHTQYEITLVFNGNNGYANAPHCYVIYTLPVLCMILGTNSDYSINWPVFDEETECVYCAVRTETLNNIWANFFLQWVKFAFSKTLLKYNSQP